MIKISHWVLFPTDCFFLLLMICVVCACVSHRNSYKFRTTIDYLCKRRMIVIATIIFTVYLIIALLDSVHLQHENRIESLLDRVIAPLGQMYEETYSSPFAITSYTRSIEYDSATQQAHQTYKPLQYVRATHLAERNMAVVKYLIEGLSQSVVLMTILLLSLLLYHVSHHQASMWTWFKKVSMSRYPVVTFAFTVAISISILFITLALSKHFHILGTDKVGQDVFYQAIKSIRTAFIIGFLTSFILLPLAVTLGMCAGYYGKRVDDVIQYLYTVVSSVPGVLLIAAAFLALQLMMSRHADLFSSVLQRAEFKLLMLCCILGMTSWTSLCRLVRAETLKLREVDFVQAAIAIGSKRRIILFKHILPNIMHIIIIATAIDFSSLVLAEAVLSYVGIGVDPNLFSWGLMINAARLELARDPIVWWPLLSAFGLMFLLVLSANLLADALRDALDPKVNG